MTRNKFQPLLPIPNIASLDCSAIHRFRIGQPSALESVPKARLFTKFALTTLSVLPIFIVVSIWAPRSVRALLLVLLCLVPRLANSQLGASAAISLVARLPGTVTLRESVIPFSITTSGEEQRSTPVQLEVKWNLDPHETQSFRIVATLSPKLEAPAQLMVRIDNSEPRLFSTHARHVLFNVPIRLENRQGRAGEEKA